MTDSNSDYILGHVAELEDSAKEFSLRAGKNFAKGSDEKAHWYRGLATEFDLKSKEKRREYEASKATDEQVL